MISTLPIVGAGTPVGAAPTSFASSFPGDLLLAAQAGDDALPLDFRAVAAALFGNDEAGSSPAETAGKNSLTASGFSGPLAARARDKSASTPKTGIALGPIQRTETALLPLQTLPFAPNVLTGVAAPPPERNSKDPSSSGIVRPEAAEAASIPEIKKRTALQTATSFQGSPGMSNFGSSVSETGSALGVATLTPAAGYSWMRATHVDRGVAQPINRQTQQAEIRTNLNPGPEPPKNSLAAPTAWPVPPAPSTRDLFFGGQVEQAPLSESNASQGHFKVAQVMPATDVGTNSGSVDTPVRAVASSAIGRALKEMPVPPDTGGPTPKPNEVQVNRGPFAIPQQFSAAPESSTSQQFPVTHLPSIPHGADLVEPEDSSMVAFPYSARNSQATAKSAPAQMLSRTFSNPEPASNVQDSSRVVASDAQPPPLDARSAEPVPVNGTVVAEAPGQMVEGAPLPSDRFHVPVDEARINQPADGVHTEPMNRSGYGCISQPSLLVDPAAGGADTECVSACGYE